MTTTSNDPLRYAGFWPRLGSLLLDFLIQLPLIAITFWGIYKYRLFNLYAIVPSTLFRLFYSVYLVRRYGGTPGKLIAGISIRKPGGEPVGYREAFLRYFPEFVFGLLIIISFIISTLHMSDAEYYALSFMDRMKRINELGPFWSKPLSIVQNIWVWGELIILLTNRKRRALHDFIAGTIVIHSRPKKNNACGQYVTEGQAKITTKKIAARCFFIFVGIIIVVVIAGIIIFQIIKYQVFVTPKELNQSFRSSNYLQKDIFLEDERLCKVTDIAFGKFDPNSELTIGVAGMKGALLLNTDLSKKVFIPFNEVSEHADIIKTNDSFYFLSRRGELFNRKTAFIDHTGKTLWTYGGEKRAVDDTAVGDLDGNGKLEFAVGFNGGDGIHLLDQSGKKLWEKSDGNVWHVEIADINNNGNFKIVHSNAASEIIVRNKNGEVVSKSSPFQYMSDFSLVNWPNRTSRKVILVSEAKFIKLLDFDGKVISSYPAPKCYNRGEARGTVVNLKENQPPYFAVAVEFRHWERTLLYVYNSAKELVYQENIPCSCASIAGLQKQNSKEESLLVGCTGTIFQYNLKQTK
jgi:uncharacterized RDD family membrane protein YckC